MILMKQYDLVAIGDAKIDIFLKFHQQSEDLHTSSDNCEMCVKLGAKIPIDHAYLSIGGDACNVSVGISRLGLRSGLMAEIGDDDFADKIIKDLKNERVSDQFLVQTKGAGSSFSMILSMKKDRTIFSQHVKRKHHFDFENLSTEWIYLTSLGEDWHKAYKDTYAFVKKHPVKLAFSPGTAQLKEGRESFEELLSVTDILFVNREEGEIIAYGQEYEDGPSRKPIDHLLHDLNKLGPKIVSVTDGTRGSYALDQLDNVLSQGLLPSRVVEKTGVGDAYAAGFLAGIIHRKPVIKAMKWGAANSSSVVEHIGATVGVLTLPEMERRI